MKFRYAFLALGFAAGAMTPAAAETYEVPSVGLPSPAGCANYQSITDGIPDAACNAAIAQERDPQAKSVMLFRRAFIEMPRRIFRNMAQHSRT